MEAAATVHRRAAAAQNLVQPGRGRGCAAAAAPAARSAGGAARWRGQGGAEGRICVPFGDWPFVRVRWLCGPGAGGGGGGVGGGVLGQRVAGALGQLEFPVNGWSRSRKTAMDGVRTFSGADGFDAFLAASRVLVNLLPLTPD